MVTGEISNSFDPSACAGMLLELWRSGRQVDALPAELRPITLADGYAAQDRLFAAAGGARAGWKLGVGSPGQLRNAALSRPLVGQLASGRIHADGVHLRLPDAAPVTIECEVAYELAHDLTPEAMRDDPAGLIANTRISFEIVRSRFVDRRAVGWPSFVADNVGFEALVLGAPQAVDSLRGVYESMVVSVDGRPATRMLEGDDAIDAPQALRYLADHARQFGITLRRGEIVSTGTMTRPFDLSGTGHRVRADFLGQSLNFSL